MTNLLTIDMNMTNTDTNTAADMESIEIRKDQLQLTPAAVPDKGVLLGFLRPLRFLDQAC